jgi:large subunit ribosomal protein L5
MNPMRNIEVEKVIINIGTGANQDKLKKAIKLVQTLTGKTPIKTISKKRIPAWGLRPGLPVGCKITLRKKNAIDLLKRTLEARENKLKKNCFDEYGNVSFGLEEYIEIPSMKYDPDIGIMGLQVSVTLKRPGYRIKRRKVKKRKIPKKNRISKQESINFFKDNFNIILDGD